MNNYFDSQFATLLQFLRQTMLPDDIREVDSDQTNIILCDIVQHQDKPVLLQINHNHLNTFLDLTSVFDFALLYFNEQNEFVGASYSLDNGYCTPFIIVTQAKTVLLLPLSKDLNLSTVRNLDITFPKNSNELCL